jgi:hypothetical protein
VSVVVAVLTRQAERPTRQEHVLPGDMDNVCPLFYIVLIIKGRHIWTNVDYVWPRTRSTNCSRTGGKT